MPITINTVDQIAVESPIAGTGAPGDALRVPNGSILAAKLASSGVTADTYTLATITVNAQGLIIDAMNGTGGSGTATTWATISAAGETSMKISYEGMTAPTLTKDTAGIFRLNVPTGTEIHSANWTANNTNLDAGAIKLVVDSVDNREYFASVDIISLSNNNVANLVATGVTVNQTITATGEVTITMPNVNGFGSSGFRAMLRF